MKRDTIVLEVSWEACRRIGGIHAFLQSRRAAMTSRYKENYLVAGPTDPNYDRKEGVTAFGGDPAVTQAVEKMNGQGFRLKYCRLSDEGISVPAVLFDLTVSEEFLNGVKHQYWTDYGIDLLYCSKLVDEVLIFGELFRRFSELLCDSSAGQRDVLIHFHEWLSASSLPALANSSLPVMTVFTAHATVPGRYLASHNHFSEESLFNVDTAYETGRFGITAEYQIERNAAVCAHASTTVSDQIARECRFFLQTNVDEVIPNGLDPSRYERIPSGVRSESRDKLGDLVKAYFYPYYHLPPENLVYLFSSGRFEFQNKGFDVLLEALSLLDIRLRETGSPVKVVQFLISSEGEVPLNPHVLESKSRLQDIRKISNQISTTVGGQIYKNATRQDGHTLNDLNSMVGDELLLRWRRALAEFRKQGNAPLSTHILQSDNQVAQVCTNLGLLNSQENSVKVIYHPRFVDAGTSPLGLSYHEFMLACDAGVFPAGYEPWGYAAMESALSGIATVMRGESGFARFLIESDLKPAGVSFLEAGDPQAKAGELGNTLFDLVSNPHRRRVGSVTTEPVLSRLNWNRVQDRYHDVYLLAASRKFGVSGLY